jgi:dTMP kinase
LSKHGFFIVFEGPEGSGKTTQASRLVNKLFNSGRKPLSLREPGGTSTGELIRKMLKDNVAGEPLAPRAELLLFEAARAQLIENVIIPRLRSGMDVVCDRFTDSTLAYQGHARGLDKKFIEDANSFAAAGLRPDITLLLDIDPEIGMKRTSEKRSGQGKQLDAIEKEDMSFHRKVRQGYLQVAGQSPWVVVLDATKSEDELEEEIWAKVSSLLA